MYFSRESELAVVERSFLFPDCADQRHDGKQHRLMLIGLNNRVVAFSSKMSENNLCVGCVVVVIFLNLHKILAFIKLKKVQKTHRWQKLTVTCCTPCLFSYKSDRVWVSFSLLATKYISVNQTISAFYLVCVWFTMKSQNSLSCLHFSPHCNCLLTSTFKARWGTSQTTPKPQI